MVKLKMFATIKFILTHPLARRKPFAALRRYGIWQIESRVRDIVPFEWIGGAKLLVRNGMTGATGNIYCGLHEFSDMGFLLHFLRPDDLFVDVGANIGSYTILAAAVCGADAISVEPDEQTARFLRANVAANEVIDRVEIVQCALGDCESVVQFTTGLDTVNHIATPKDSQTCQVRLRRLDEVAGDRNPKLLKIDVEGYEAQVLAGAGEFLQRPSLQAIITEGAGADVRDPLENHGFRPYAYDPFSRSLLKQEGTQVMGRHNALFIRNPEEVLLRLRAAKRRTVSGVQV